MAVLAAGCATARTSDPGAVSGMTPQELGPRLADADALAAQGCYLCLRDAAFAYQTLLRLSEDPGLARRALENDLLIAIREIELRLPDSGARARARALAARNTATPGKYDACFQLLDSLDTPPDSGTATFSETRDRQAGRRALAAALETEWPSSAMAAYFYIAAAVGSGQLTELKPQVDAILATYAHNLSVRYRFQAYAPTFSEAAANELLAEEPRFAEIHFLLGQRAVFGAALVTAHRELTEASRGLPDSLAIASSLGRLELVFARYAEALALFDRMLARGPDEAAQLGRAIALSYLQRHREAIAVLDDLLKDPSTLPGDKYYWRAWNYLALIESQQAYDDAKLAMNAMANSEVFKLAGIASYNLTRITEARGYFESSVKMNAAECDASRYLGIIDAAERSWRPAAEHFTTAAACYERAIAALEADVAMKQADPSGLYAGQVAAIQADIAEARLLLDASRRNADVAARAR
jgi:tetratricopeptide (TPR) repeat protein